MTSHVGLLELPIPAGVLNAELPDYPAKGFLDYLAFWLRLSLNAKLAQMQGTSANAVPIGNTYPWDPSAHFVRNSFPALYVWWDGRSTTEPQTMLSDKRIRQFGVTYVFDELEAPNGKRSRTGLIPAVDAVISKASARGMHSAYGFNGDALGTPLYRSLRLLSWRYTGGEEGFMAKIPNVSERAGGPSEGFVVRGYPALNGTITVEELIGEDEPDETSYLVDGSLDFYGTDGDEAVFIMGRYLDPLDGSEGP